MQQCHICGCTDMNACMTPKGPCYWVELDLCSACAYGQLVIPPGVNS